MIKRYIGISLLTASVLVAGCSSSDDDDPVVVTPPTPDPYVAPDGTTLNLIETATNNPELSQFLALLDQAGLTANFAGTAVNTVFAPSNAALDAETAGPGVIAGLDAAGLVDLLGYHVNNAASGFTAAQLTALAGTDLAMSNGDVAAITSDVDGLKIGGSLISTSDGFATNGILHVIDTVLTVPADVPVDPPVDPPTGDNIIAALTGTAGYATFLALIDETGFTDTFTGDNEGAGWTMFAPDDAAMAAADPSGLDAAAKSLFVRRHVLTPSILSTALTSGPQTMNSNEDAEVVVGASSITIGGATITSADNASANGFLNLINAVIVANP